MGREITDKEVIELIREVANSLRQVHTLEQFKEFICDLMEYAANRLEQR